METTIKGYIGFWGLLGLGLARSAVMPKVSGEPKSFYQPTSFKGRP